MSASTRLYARLAQIPQDASDPESLADLVVCAFGAFERYYVCWKNRGGAYRQDGYDLPPTLHAWLWPPDGSARDYASLQVVFGRGDAYFAADRSGKVECKAVEGEEKGEKMPGLRRARTVSLLRPRADTGGESSTVTRRSMSVEERIPSTVAFARPVSEVLSVSQWSSSSRPPSTTFSRPVSEASYPSQPSTRPSSTSSAILPKPAFDTEINPTDSIPETTPKDTIIETPPSSTWARLTRRSRPLSMTFTPSAFAFAKIEEGKRFTSTAGSPIRDPARCPCNCHHSSAAKPKLKPSYSYSDASVQTSPSLSPPRTALRIDTSSASNSSYNTHSSTLSLETPDLVAAHPFPMGRMLDYFSKPSYQLGDSLMSSYYYEYQEPVYEYQGEFADAPWGSAAGRRHTA